MNRLKPVLVLALAMAATLAWPVGLCERGFRPDFLLLFALGAGFFGREPAGLLAGVAAGLLAAPLTLEPFGLDAALLGAAGLLAGKLRVYLTATHPGVQGVLAALFFLLGSLVRLLLLELSGADAASLGMIPAVLAGTVATATAAPVVLFLMDGLRVFRAPEQGRPVLV